MEIDFNFFYIIKNHPPFSIKIKIDFKQSKYYSIYIKKNKNVEKRIQRCKRE